MRPIQHWNLLQIADQQHNQHCGQNKVHTQTHNVSSHKSWNNDEVNKSEKCVSTKTNVAKDASALLEINWVIFC